VLVSNNNPLNIILLINSIVLSGLILNQNDSTKDSATTQNSNFSSNPIELFTWICVFFQLILLLIKLKITDF
jgi:hypothetical protein